MRCCRYDNLKQRALLECRDQQGLPRGEQGHAWTCMLQPNGTLVSFHPQSQTCSAEPSGGSNFSAVFPPNWPSIYGYPKWATVNGINCTTYYEFHDIAFLAASGQWAVSPEGVPVRYQWGLGDGPHPPVLPFIQLDVLGFAAGEEAPEERYRPPSYCPNRPIEAERCPMLLPLT